MSDDLVLNSLDENYDDDITDLDKEIEDLESLYKKSYSLMESVSKSRGKGSLSFTHLQTSNLISIKNAKIAAIRSRSRIKNNRFSEKFKKLNAGVEGDTNNIPISQLLNLLDKSNVSFRVVQEISERRENDQDDVDLDNFEDEINKALEGDDTPVSTEIEEEETENSASEEISDPFLEIPKEKESEDSIDTSIEIVSDTEGNIYAIDLNNSTPDAIVLADKDALNIGPEERASISENSSGIPCAIFRGKEIEIVDIEW